MAASTHTVESVHASETPVDGGSNIELTATNPEVQENIDAESTGLAEFSLPPADHGKDAWLFLAGCFIVEVLVWGKQNLTSHQIIYQL